MSSARSTWARKLFAEAAPHATGGVYVNFMPEDEIDRVSSAYGANYARLAALKAKYDPGNLFRLNQNVRAVRAATGGLTRDKGRNPVKILQPRRTRRYRGCKFASILPRVAHVWFAAEVRATVQP